MSLSIQHSFLHQISQVFLSIFTTSSSSIRSTSVVEHLISTFLCCRMLSSYLVFQLSLLFSCQTQWRTVQPDLAAAGCVVGSLAPKSPPSQLKMLLPPLFGVWASLARFCRSMTRRYWSSIHLCHQWKGTYLFLSKRYSRPSEIYLTKQLGKFSWSALTLKTDISSFFCECSILRARQISLKYSSSGFYLI